LARFHPQRQFWHDAWAGTRLVTWVAPAKTKQKAGNAKNSAVAPDQR
jgi:hypothetical protein